MRNYVIIIFLSFTYVITFGQQSIKAVFEETKGETFSNIIAKAELYFQSHPFQDEERKDGEYAKYSRWKTFWQDRIDTDGRLADLGFYGSSYSKTSHSRSAHRFEEVTWDNITYLEDLGVQIGLGRTNCIAFHPTDPSIYYVGAAIGGIWKTTDGGLSYTAIGDELPFLAVSSIIINRENPEIIYAAISDRVWYGPPSIGIYVSRDGGSTWTPTSVSLDFESNTQIYWMEADPNNPLIMYYATSNGLYRTKDGFESSQFVASGRIVDVKFKPGSSDILYYARTNTNSVYRSDNGGENFTLVENFGGSSYVRLAVSSLDPEKLYVSTDNRLYKSFDGGHTFTEEKSLANTNNGDGILMISPKDDEKLYAGFFDVYRSNNDGGLFIPITHWLGNFGLQLIHVDQRNAFINPLQPDFIYFCNDGGIYRLDVNNNVFTNLSNGLSITQFYDIAVSQTDLSVMSGGSQDNGNVFMDDYIWTYAAPTADGMMQAIDPTNSSIRYNGIQNGTLYRFQGSQRTEISSKIPGNKSGQGEWITPFLLDPNNPQTIVAGYDEVYKSTNRGTSWSSISEKLAQGRKLDFLTIAPSNSERLYAVENYGFGTGNHYGGDFSIARIYTKDTLSNEWQNNIVQVDEPVRDIIVNPKNADHIYVCVSGFTDGHKVFESMNAGITWNNISGNLPNAPVTAIAYHQDQEENYLIVGTDAGVFFKDETSPEWFKMGELPNTYITDIEIQREANFIRISTHGRGIFEADLSGSPTSVTSRVKNSDCFNIQPNPATDYATINSKESNFEIEVFNLRGQLMHRGSQNQLDLTQMTPGTYIAKLRNRESKDLRCAQKLVINR